MAFTRPPEPSVTRPRMTLNSSAMVTNRGLQRSMSQRSRMRSPFTVAPIVFGLDKFFDVLVTGPSASPIDR